MNEIFWLFILSGVFGVILENIFCLIKHGHFESRAGVLYGPFNLVYALAGLLLVLVSVKINPKRDRYLFLLFALLGGCLEFILSYLQEMVFDTVSWNYSATTFNIYGRTNLLYCLMWGAAALFFVRDIYPLIKKFAGRLNSRKGRIFTKLTILVITLDLILSFGAVYRYNQRYQQVPAQGITEKLLDKYYDDNFIERKFPNMVHAN